MDQNIANQIEAQLNAAEGRLPMLRPRQALALVRLTAAVRSAAKEGRLIIAQDGTDTEGTVAAEAEFGQDLTILNEFIMDMQIGSAQVNNWAEL